MFYWADERGQMHITDRLDQVPEPYYSIYAERIKKMEAANTTKTPTGATPSQPPTPSVGQNWPKMGEVSRAEIAKQQYWKSKVQNARAVLMTATDELRVIDEQIQQKHNNPLLAQTPEVAAELSVLEAKRQQIEQSVVSARKVLLVDIPQQAKKEGIPPKWLQ